MNDIKLVKWLLLLLALPIGLAMCGGDKFRYPCQDPANWDKALMLPTERFVKATKFQVWNDSKGMVR